LSRNKKQHAESKSPSLEAIPVKQGFTRRIGTTTYRVRVHFSPNSKETASDKILRMIKNETAGKAAAK
jgi:hypothetical protein